VDLSFVCLQGFAEASLRCSAAAALADAGMIEITIRGRAYVISAIMMLSILAFIHEKDFLNSAYVTVTAHIGGSSASLHRWMQLCDLELYPNLKWDTVMSQHGSGQPAMTVFVPYAVENNWAIWDSPDVDDSDFHDCPTSCVWIRNRDTSMEGLRRNAHCAAQAQAVLIWFPLGHPYKTSSGSDVEAITTSGLIHSDNQIWLGVGTEPGMMNARRSTPTTSSIFGSLVTPVCSAVQCHHKL